MNHYKFSENSRVWIYQSEREFSSGESEKIISRGCDFIKSWNSHGAPINAAFEIFYHRFIVIFADENSTAASGCSIDKSVHFMKQLEQDFNTSLFNRMLVAYKENEKVSVFHLNKLNQMLAQKIINESTVVFNNLVSTKKEFETSWEIPLSQSWIAQLM